MHEQVEAGRTARDGGRVRRADSLGDLLLEPVDRRPERQAPGPEHLEDELLFPLVEIRPREWNSPRRGRSHAWAGVGDGIVAYSSQCDQRSLPPRTVSR